jgi:hypothetical protein
MMYDGVAHLKSINNNRLFPHFCAPGGETNDAFEILLARFHEGYMFNLVTFRHKAISTEVDPEQMLVEVLNDIRQNFSNHKDLRAFLHYVDPRILGLYCDRFNINFFEVKDLFKQYILTNLDFMWMIRNLNYCAMSVNYKNTHKKRYQIYNIYSSRLINDYFY